MNCTVPINPNPLPEDVPLAQRPQACNDYMRFFEQQQLPALGALATKACNIDTLLTFNNYKGDGIVNSLPLVIPYYAYNDKDVVRVGNDFFVSQRDNNPLTVDATGAVISVPGTSKWEKLPIYTKPETATILFHYKLFLVAPGVIDALQNTSNDMFEVTDGKTIVFKKPGLYEITYRHLIDTPNVDSTTRLHLNGLASVMLSNNSSSGWNNEMLTHKKRYVAGESVYFIYTDGKYGIHNNRFFANIQITRLGD